MAATSALAEESIVATPWGNLEAILVDGERFVFETSLRAIDPDWTGFTQSSKYNWEGQQSFERDGDGYVSSHSLQGLSLNYTTRITPEEPGAAVVDARLEAADRVDASGVYFCVELPAADFAGARIELLGADSSAPATRLEDRSGLLQDHWRARAQGARIVGARRQIEIIADESTELILRQDFTDNPGYLNDPRPRRRFVDSDPRQAVSDFQIYFTLSAGSMERGERASGRFRVRVAGEIDRQPVALDLDATRPGRRFDGIGGNFRMQFPELDPQVVQYCIENLDVAWGRVAFPWNEWAPEEGSDVADAVGAGRISRFFQAQLDIARYLAQRDIPIMLAVWDPPAWAVDGGVSLPKGVKLDERKLDSIADSVADYLAFLK